MQTADFFADSGSVTAACHHLAAKLRLQLLGLTQQKASKKRKIVTEGSAPQHTETTEESFSVTELLVEKVSFSGGLSTGILLKLVRSSGVVCQDQVLQVQNPPALVFQRQFSY